MVGGKRRREAKRLAHPGILERRDDFYSSVDVPFAFDEMMRGISRSGVTSPGKDEICHAKAFRLFSSIHKMTGLL